MTQQQSTSESLLLKLKSASDDDAWRQFVSLYTPLIFFWARKNGMTHEDAGDVVQDVLAIVFRKLPMWKYDPEGSFRGWLRKITLNRHRELYRKKQVPLANQSLSSVADPRFAETSWDANYHHQLMNSAIELLRNDFAPETWAALKKLLGSNRPATEVAAESGVSVWTLYSARNRLLGRLREKLEGLME